MRVLLDEGIPQPLLDVLRIDESHYFDHVNLIGLAGTPDIDLFGEARHLGFGAYPGLFEHLASGVLSLWLLVFAARLMRAPAN